jgi:Polyketide cyclase / dehydrase and lipid transport
MTKHVSRWGEDGARPAPLPENRKLFSDFTITASTPVNCSTADAWDLITSISRIGEFSPECIDAQWIEGADGPKVGARFEGTNSRQQGADEIVWIRPCTVTVSVPGQAFAYVVGDRFDATPAVEWEYRLEATNGECLINQTFRHLPDGLSGVRGMADAEPEKAAGIVPRRREVLANGMKGLVTRTVRSSLAVEATEEREVASDC